MHKALFLKYPDSGIPGATTVYRVMTAIGITHRPNRKLNGITKADREARKSKLKMASYMCRQYLIVTT